MFALIWTVVLFFVRGTDAQTGTSADKIRRCDTGICITPTVGELTGEAGLCVVIPCSFTVDSGFIFSTIAWYKCEAATCSDSDIIFHAGKSYNNNLQAEYRGRVSLLEPDVRNNNCSIIINDLRESDSGSYQLRVHDELRLGPARYLFSPKATVTVKGLTQKPSVIVPSLTDGQRTTLTCTAPGLCSGSPPKFSWTWRGAGGKKSRITGSITDFQTESLTAGTRRYSSTLTFTPSAEHHDTKITCKVHFTGGLSTEETLALNVNYVKEVQITGDRNPKMGDTLSLTCSVESFLPSFIAWTKHNHNGSLSKSSTSSTLVVPNMTAEHSGPYICEASYRGRSLFSYVNITVSSDLERSSGSSHPVLPWVVAGVSLSVNVLFIFFISCLWNSRKKVKPNQEDSTYMSLQKTDVSPEYEVITQRRN
ncbi:sialic acid-binding Ig-like lectin 14 isoform X1 [Stegastes partitus]|nr:PREDICTED: sialic acid-binding Ig-like lectin 14 isoform X1 [Stegastes partitus]